MIDRFRSLARALVTVLVLGMAGAAAQTGQPPAPPTPDPAPRATAPAPGQPAGPQIDVADITARANRDVGVDIQATITGWQKELDRLDSELQRQRLRYSELNNLRDEVLRIRGVIQEFWGRLETPLT